MDSILAMLKISYQERESILKRIDEYFLEDDKEYKLKALDEILKLQRKENNEICLLRVNGSNNFFALVGETEIMKKYTQEYESIITKYLWESKKNHKLKKYD